MDKTDESFVTRKMLELTKQELKSDLTTLRLEVRQYRDESKPEMALFRNEVTAELQSLEQRMAERFNQVDMKFHQVEVRFNKVDLEISQIHTTMAKMMVMMEEQNMNWKLALDGYGLIYDRQANHEQRIAWLESPGSN